jgi:hypothetical protein
MRFATLQEIEYLDSVDGKTPTDLGLIDEMSRRLDALRCLDQFFCKEDWRPEGPRDAARGDCGASAF